MPNGCVFGFFSHFVVRLVGVPCPQVKTAIVSQIKIMGSYKVSIFAQTCAVLGPPPGSAVNLTLFVFSIQLGPVTPTSVQANHTSAVGQVESVNFTVIPTTMTDGCHVQVTQVFADWGGEGS